MSQGAKFDGGRELEQLRQKDPLTGALIRRVIDAINRLGSNVGAAAMGEVAAPPPVDSISVKGTLDTGTNTLTVPGEILHFVHTHNAPLSRGIRYVTEIDTDPNFTNPHAIMDSTSRSGVSQLPTMDDSSNPVNYYLRVTPQYPGSAPGKPTVFGGRQGATTINFSGTTAMSLLASQASGTARPGQGGKALGPVQSRPAVGGPKRTLGS